MLLASAFENIDFISVSKIISSALYIFKASPTPVFIVRVPLLMS